MGGFVEQQFSVAVWRLLDELERSVGLSVRLVAEAAEVRRLAGVVIPRSPLVRDGDGDDVGGAA